MHYRYETYRNIELARRAFYKWCCREGLYGPLYVQGENSRGRKYYAREPCPGYGCTTYMYGIPVFNYHRSEAMDRWNREFTKHRDPAKKKIEEDEMREFETRYQASERQRILRNPNTRRFFRMMSAASTINEQGSKA